METNDSNVHQFFKTIESSFNVLVLSKEQIVYALLEGEPMKGWVYDSQIESRAIALGLSTAEVREAFISLEKKGLILKGSDSDQGGLHVRHALVQMHVRKTA